MDEHPQSCFSWLKKKIFSRKSPHFVITDHNKIDLFQNINIFLKTTVRELMEPRTKMITIEENQTISEAIELINQYGYSGIPVQEKTPDKIKGILYAKNIFAHIDQPKLQIHQIMQPVLFAPYSQLVIDLMKSFKDQKTDLAIVIDEYGGVDGLIKIEDIIGELINVVHNEFNGTAEKPNYMDLGRHIIMDADYSLDAFNKLYHTNYLEEGIETIGGYICHRLEKIPEKQEQFIFDTIKFVVEDRNHKVLTKLKISHPDHQN